MKAYKLYNDVEIPGIAFGTWQIPDGEIAYNSVKYALEVGYRLIDTAYAYQNEKSIGKAIKDSKIPREEIFITTKIPAEVKTYDGAIECFNKSLADLELDYVDLLLIHAPWPWSEVGKDCTEGNIAVWKALIDLYNEKKVRAIGVSNFHPKDIIPLISATGVKPMVNQIRFFIGNTQDHIYTYCQANGIQIMAYSPLGTGTIASHEKLEALANKYNATIPKICIQYCIQKNTIPLPKSTHEERIKDNFKPDIVLSLEDMSYLDSLKAIGSTRPLRS